MSNKYNVLIKKLRWFEQYPDKMIRTFPELFPVDMDSSHNPGVMTVTFQVTDACNLRCTYCYQLHKGVKKMSAQTGKAAIDELLSDNLHYCNTKVSPVLILDFIGGEPFLAIDEMEEIYEYFLQRTIELRHPWALMHFLSITSNGVLYFNEKVQNFLNKYQKSIGLSITMDGNKELHDSCRIFPDGSPSYDYAYNAIKDWMDRGLYMGSKVTLAPENIEYLYSAVKHMIELGYQDINANVVFEQKWQPEHEIMAYNQLKDLADYIIDNDLYFSVYFRMFDHNSFRPMVETDNKNWCGSTQSMLAIDPDGYYYPCLRFMESSLNGEQEPYRIGKVGDCAVGVDGIYKERLQCLNCVTRRSQSTDECFNCPVAMGCAWCTAYNYQVTGDVNKRLTYHCGMHKATSLANVYYWNKLFQKLNIDLYFEMWLPKEDAIAIIGEEEYQMLKILATNENKHCINPKESTEGISEYFDKAHPIGGELKL